MALDNMLKPEGVDYWHDLSEDEKKVIVDSLDYPIFSIVYGIPQEILKPATLGLKVKKEYFDIYSKEEGGWIKFFNDCYEKNNGIKIHPDEKDNSSEANEIRVREFSAFLQSHLMEIYSLYYLAKYPYRMEIPIQNPNLSKIITQFLTLEKSRFN
jgi:hypothetical protein